MIGYLKGIILVKGERDVTMLVNGVGYQVHLPQSALDRAEERAERSYYTHTHVREDALELYGFETYAELEFFERLITISGVGPKSGLGVLSVAPLSDIKKAIIHGDAGLLQKVTSIGKKTAERIIIELKEKISVSEKEAGGMNISDTIQLHEALSSLGYGDREIRDVLKKIPAENRDLSEKIKASLKILGAKRN